MDIVFDTTKRGLTLEHRGLDFADAATIFSGCCFTAEDDRQDYGEVRYITVGRLAGWMAGC